jgi:hypothetical protein
MMPKMSSEVFHNIMIPIVARWKQSFPNPVMLRIYEHVNAVDSYAFQKIVNHFLDSSRVAPLPQDFRDAARAEARAKAVQAGSPIFSPDYKNDGLAKFLASDYPGCNNLLEALEVEKIRLKARRAAGVDDDYPWAQFMKEKEMRI